MSSRRRVNGFEIHTVAVQKGQKPVSLVSDGFSACRGIEETPATGNAPTGLPMGFLWDTLEQGVSPPPPVLDAEVRIGELTAAIPKATQGTGGNRYVKAADRVRESNTAVTFSKQPELVDKPEPQADEPVKPKPSAPVVKPPIPAPEPPKRQRAGSKPAPGYSISL